MSGDRYQFERCWPWLCAAVERYGHTHEKEHIWDAIERGAASLCPLPHAAILTSIESHPTGLKECYAWLAGGDLREIVAVEPHLANLHKQAGCHRVALRARPGWQRALNGYRMYGSILIKDL